MTYCPECGSEVAAENTFCAYCGIALTPVQPLAEHKSIAALEAVAPPETIAADDNRNAQIPNPGIEPSRADFGAAQQTEDAPPLSTFADNPAQLPDWSVQTIEPSAEIASSSPSAESTSPNSSPDGESLDSSDGEAFAETARTEGSAPDTDAASTAPENEISGKIETENEFSAKTEIREITAAGSVDEFAPENAGADKIDSNKTEFEQSDKTEFGQTDLEFDDKNEDSSRNINPPVLDNNAVAEFGFGESKNASDFSSDFSDASDLQSTVPYAAGELARQAVISPETGAEENNTADSDRLNEGESNVNLTDSAAARRADDSVAENPPPIPMPDAPVGSSARDNLEPQLVSVRIYNPDETPAAASSGGNNSPDDAETPLNNSAPVISESAPAAGAKESRSYTSPNIAGDDTDGRNKAKLKPLDEGTVLNGRYEIVRKIGGGGMGAVYLASDRNLGGVLRAVKEMVQSYIEDAQQEKAASDFKRESLLLSTLEHQSIPTIYDYFFDEKEARFYLVMKYISGGDLAGRLRAAAEGRIDEAVVTEWSIQIADVLDYLHNRQPPIIYRDLKPSNVMVDGNSGRVMLVDFGIARWVNKEEKGVTAIGTMGYAPPELFSGNVEPRSDIYSLGSTMFHLLTGADPQSNPLLIFDFQKNPRPRQINSALSDQMEQILTRAVEYSFDKRFGSAAELRDQLIKHLENLRKGNVTYGAGDKSARRAPTSDEMVFCGFCGQKIIATDVFCPFCGAQQPLAAQAAKIPASFAQPKPTARVMVVSTNELDAPIFNLEKDANLVGRRDPMSNIFPEVDLSKFDPQTKISRRHARIWRETDAFMVEDLGSSNGTTLIAGGGEPRRLAKNQPHVLSNGDKIRVGDTTLHFIVN